MLKSPDRGSMQNAKVFVIMTWSRTAAMTAAANAVFETTELLEMVLLELPLWDTIRLQRVNRKYRSVIPTSPRLQAALFVRSKRTKSLIKGRNPLLLNEENIQHLYPHIPHIPHIESKGIFSHLDHAWNNIRGGPVLFQELMLIRPTMKKPYWVLYLNVEKHFRSSEELDKAPQPRREREQISAQEESWYKMLLVNPSGLDVWVTLSDCFSLLERMEKRFPAWATFGDVHEWLVKVNKTLEESR